MSFLMLALTLQATAPAVPAPAPEALALGIELAQSGPLAVLLPAIIEKDMADLATEDATLTAADRATLLAIGRAEGAATFDRVARLMGAAYAKRLSMVDLRALVAFHRTPAARQWRDAQAPVMIETMQGVAAVGGDMDLKKAAAKTFCTQRGKLCARD